MTSLPVFQDSRDFDPGRPPDDKLQAIVPALSFTCTGKVTDQGGGGERYYFQFQVWRSAGVQGCYTLVGSNAPSLSAGGVVDENLLLAPSGRSVLLPVGKNEQIEFQPGDVNDWLLC